MPSVIMLSVFMPSVIMLSVIMPSAVLLIVVAQVCPLQNVKLVTKREIGKGRQHSGGTLNP